MVGIIELEENRHVIRAMKSKLGLIGDSFDLNAINKRLEELHKQINDPGFWTDNSNATTILTETKRLENKISYYEKLEKELTNLEELNELLIQDPDEEMENEVLRNTKILETKIEKMQLETLLSGKYDKNNAIVTLHPGAGGTESQDWVQMLYRMYTRWGSANRFQIKELEYLEGEEAGIKSVTFLVMGENAFGYLKGENGVHRLVRISPFDSGGRRHTSFASAEVLPEISDDVQIDINPEDLRIDTYRASGAGGQHVNKTDSAVRITHIPTGVVTTCQSERSQIQNRETAMKMLKSRLVDLKEKEHKDKIEDLKGIQKEIAWGSQIRSYVFCPYTLVKDHRTGYETGNVESVMDGNIDLFIEAYLKYQIREQNQ